MRTQEISALQLKVLDGLGIAELVGRSGIKWVSRSVRATTYDPATTYQTFLTAFQKISAAKSKLNEFKSSALNVGVSLAHLSYNRSGCLISIIFQRDASIKNVRDWKTTASDWELIVAGVAGVVGEKAEDVEVVGTSNGSIIFTLLATPAFTRILATIAKHLAGIANDFLDFQLKREELTRSRMMSQVIKDELDRQELERRATNLKTVTDAVALLAPNATPEALTKLGKSVERYITFSESGGGTDFVVPQSSDDGSSEVDEGLVDALREIREIVGEYRLEQQTTRLLARETDESEEEDL